MPEYQEILYEKKRGGALITLNRPDAMNAISRSMIKELHQALDEVEEDNEVRAVVLTGAGRAFSAGMDQGNRAGRRRDIHWPYGIVHDQTAAEVIDSWRIDPRNFRRMWEFGKPIIGAINGWAMPAFKKALAADRSALIEVQTDYEYVTPTATLSELAGKQLAGD